MEEFSLKNNLILDLSHCDSRDIFDGLEFPWEALPKIEAYILQRIKLLDLNEYEVRENNVYIHKTAKVFPTAYFGKNVIVEAGAEIRHCAFIRENAIIGKGSTVGNSTELKNVLLFDQVEVPHYNYIGDSILGFKAHFGCQALTSNVKNDKTYPVVKTENETYETKLRKFGAIVGDMAQVGCGSVLNPGCILGARVNIYPLSSVRGYVKSDYIYKNKDSIVKREEKI